MENKALQGIKAAIWWLALCVLLAGLGGTGPYGCTSEADLVLQGELIRVESGGRDWAVLRWVDPGTGAVCYGDAGTVNCFGGDQ